MIHAESNRLNLINQKSVYVALSRARDTGTIYTDSTAKLLEGAAGRKGESPTAATQIEPERAKQEADRARDMAKQQNSRPIDKSMDQLRERIKALTGREIGNIPTPERKEPEAPKVQRGPEMRR